MNALVPLSLMRPAEARFGWTDEAIETLKRLCGEGFSASQIALEMGITSRCAVIGKAARLGITLHGKQTNGYAHRESRAKEYPRGASGTARKAPSPVNPDQDLRSRSALAPRPTRSHQRQSAPADAPSRAGKGRPKRTFNLAPKKAARLIERDTAAPESKWISVVDLDDSSCRWPKGDPQDLDTFAYCGAQAEAERPYCSHHCGLAYVGTAAAYAKSTERTTWLMKA